MSVFDDFLAANAEFAGGFGDGHLQAPPVKHLAVVTCMDARVRPIDALGLANGDAHVIRNAGGRVTDDAVRSLLVSTHVLDVRAIAVVQHTECGMAKFSDEQLREMTGADIDFAAIADPDADLLGDVERLRAAPLAEGTEVHGYVYDVRTGRLRQVV